MTSLFDSLPLTEKRLLTLLQYSLWAKVVNTNLFAEVSFREWKEIMELAAVQGVFGLAYDGLKGLPEKYRPSKDILIQWALGVKQIENRHHLQVKALRSLAEIYKENDIRCLLIKGIGMGQLYPIPEHRECGDIDIYLFGDYAKGNSVIQERGIKVDYPYGVHSKFVFEQISVENHLSFMYVEISKTNREFEQILLRELSRSLPQLSEELGVYIPSLSFSLLHLHQHAVRHFLGQGIVLRQLCDWALLLDQCRDNSDYQGFYETIKRFDLQHYAKIFNYIAVEYLGLPENNQFTVSQDYKSVQKVYSDIINQERIHSYPSNINMPRLLKRKMKGAVFLFRSRWKYNVVNRKTFYFELMLRIRRSLLIFNSNNPVN
jgi:hypothetical protein